MLNYEQELLISWNISEVYISFIINMLRVINTEEIHGFSLHILLIYILRDICNTSYIENDLMKWRPPNLSELIAYQI